MSRPFCGNGTYCIFFQRFLKQACRVVFFSFLLDSDVCCCLFALFLSVCFFLLFFFILLFRVVVCLLLFLLVFLCMIFFLGGGVKGMLSFVFSLFCVCACVRACV